MESFVYSELKRSSLNFDKSKIETLGPFAAALNTILEGAQSNRRDLNVYDHNKLNDLWRGGSLTADEIK